MQDKKSIKKEVEGIMRIIAIARAIREVKEESGSIAKMNVLKKYADLPGFKDVLKFIYNPYLKTGISEAKLAKAEDMKYGVPHSCISYDEVIEHFSRHNTGSDADLRFAASFIRSTPDEAKWLARAIVTQELTIGITSVTLNKVYGHDFIPKIGCMLGRPISDVAPNITWPCIITEKLDGARRILIKEGSSIRFFTRSGHEDTGLVDLVKEARVLPTNMVYDGELLAIGKFRDSIALRQATNSIANSGGAKTGLTFHIFDMIPLQEFYMGRSSMKAIDRKAMLGATFRDDSIQALVKDHMDYIKTFGIDTLPKFIRPVPILGLAKSIADVEPIVDSITKYGGEGVMLNVASGLYEVKRSSQLIKIKKIKEEVLEVVWMIEGNGKYAGMLGALVAEWKGNMVRVGSGFTDQERQEIWDNQSKYIGRKFEIDTFGESINALGQRSLNCPIFKRFID